jgi:hypothetical protein
MAGFENESAAKRQRAEMLATDVARVKGLDCLRADFDALDRIAGALSLRYRRDGREHKQRGDNDQAAAKVRCNPHAGTILAHR